MPDAWAHEHAAWVLGGAAVLGLVSGDLTRAITLYEATLSDSERILGADHPITITVRGNLQRARARAQRL